MKKLLCVLLLALIVCMSFVGCSKDDQKLEEAIHLSVWTYYNGVPKDVFYQLVDEFNQTAGKENNIFVEPRTTGSVNELAVNIYASAKEDIGAEPMPDIFMAYSASALQIDQLGLVLDLDPYFTQEELDSYHKDFLEDGRFGEDNALKIIPIAKSSEVLFVNETSFDLFANEVDVDRDLFASWEGLIQIAKQYYDWTDGQTEAPNDGKAFFGVDSVANYMLVGAQQLGSSLYQISDDRATVSLTPEVAKKLWDNFYVPYVNGYYGHIGNFRSDDVKTGDLLAYTGSTASASWFPRDVQLGKDEAFNIKGIAYPLPVFEGAEPISVQQGAGMVVVKSDEPRQQAAVLFLKWLTQTEQNSKFALQTGYLPVKTQSLSIDAFHKGVETYCVDGVDPLVERTAETIYEMLEEHTMYAPKPFYASEGARTILENSLLDYATQDLLSIEEGMKTDTKDNVIAAYATDENFQVWYEQITAQLSEMIGA